MFESSVIDAYESFNCPRCEKMDLKIIQSHKNAGKPNNLWGIRIFLKNSRQFNCSGQTRDLNNHH